MESFRQFLTEILIVWQLFSSRCCKMRISISHEMRSEMIWEAHAWNISFASSLYLCQERNYVQFTPRSWCRPCCTCHYWCSGSSEGCENGPKWFPRSKHISLESRIKSVPVSDEKLDNLIHKVGDDLVVHVVVDVQVHLSVVKMVPNDSLGPST